MAGDGRPLPPRWLYRLAWALHRALYALSGGRLGMREAGPDRRGSLRLTTIGRRSRRPRAVMLYYLADGERYALIASNAGSDAPPAWWLNLQAEPDAVVELPGRSVEVRARAADATEQARLWERFVAISDEYARYAAGTERPIPIVILEPRAAAGGSERPAPGA